MLAYGARSDGFFPDTFAGQLAADARAAGHHAVIARVYQVGDRGDGDRAIGNELRAWLDAERVDVVALERVVDAAPIAAWKRDAPGRRVVLVTRGDSIEPTADTDAIVGWQRGATASGGTRRAVTVWQIADAFVGLLAALAADAPLTEAPGVATVVDGAIALASPLPPEAADRRALAPVLDHHVIARGPAPVITRRTLFGNAGCPYAADPRALPLYRDLAYPPAIEIAQLGCAFCSLGGDYQRRPDAAVIASLVAQARHITTHAPTTTELVLDDQHALRYLATLVVAAAEAGLPPVRWLFAARSDTFVRERARVEAAIAAAAATGHAIEVYLTGFEAFSDVELVRYNKGTTVAEQLAAIAAMRALAAAHPRAFHCATARGHSLLLWNPWTTPEDLAQSIAVIRAHDLVGLFHELGRNRLRLYPDLPIFHAAARDGALVDAWDDGDHGAGRGKGYHVERPWRFLDVRTALAWRLAGALRATLGLTTEAVQLAAAADHAAAWRGGRADLAEEVATITAALDALAAALVRLARRSDGPRRGQQVRATVVDDPRGIIAARTSELPIVWVGALDPTAIAAAAGPERRAVGAVVRGPVTPTLAVAAVAAGLTAASVDGTDDDVRALAAAGVAAVELRVAPTDGATAVTRARALPITQLRVEVDLHRLGLGHAATATADLAALVAAATAAGVAVEVSPLDTGTTLAAWMPVVPSRTR